MPSPEGLIIVLTSRLGGGAGGCVHGMLLPVSATTLPTDTATRQRGTLGDRFNALTGTLHSSGG